MNVRPINQQVIIRVKKQEEISGGIILPDTASNGNKWIGIVEAISPEIENCQLKVGYMVKHNPHGAQTVEDIDTNTKLIAVGYDDIYCVVED